MLLNHLEEGILQRQPQEVVTQEEEQLLQQGAMQEVRLPRMEIQELLQVVIQAQIQVEAMEAV